jgi:DNA-binding transcriptional LysR family regulator
MLDWDDLRFMLAVHRTGTLSRAGASLKLNPTTVGRRLATLEKRVGARLFDRTPDGYVLTPEGRELIPHAERMEAEVMALERSITGADQRLAGIVRVTATEMLATRFIAPHLHRFAQKYPEIQLALSCTNRSVSLSRREADVALRLSRPSEPDVVARKLSQIELALYASREYLTRYGKPTAPDRTLSGHRVLMFADSRAFTDENLWFEPRLSGATVVLRSDSVSSLYSATVGGLGLAMLPRAVADADPLLERIETQSSPEPRTIWQMVHRDLVPNARVKVVRDFLAKILTAPGM